MAENLTIQRTTAINDVASVASPSGEINKQYPGGKISLNGHYEVNFKGTITPVHGRPYGGEVCLLIPRETLSWPFKDFFSMPSTDEKIREVIGISMYERIVKLVFGGEAFSKKYGFFPCTFCYKKGTLILDSRNVNEPTTLGFYSSTSVSSFAGMHQLNSCKIRADGRNECHCVLIPYSLLGALFNCSNSRIRELIYSKTPR